MGDLRFVAVALKFPPGAAARWRKHEAVAALEAMGTMSGGRGAAVRITGSFEAHTWLTLEATLMEAVAQAADLGASGHAHVGHASGEVFALTITTSPALVPVAPEGETAAWASLEEVMPARLPPPPEAELVVKDARPSTAPPPRVVADLGATVVTLHRGPSGRIWAGLADGLAVSADGGASWGRVSGAGKGVIAAVFERADGSVWIAGFKTPLRGSREGRVFEAAAAVRAGERAAILEVGGEVIAAGAAPSRLVRLGADGAEVANLPGDVLAGAAWGDGAVLFGARGAAWHWNGGEAKPLATGVRQDFLAAAVSPTLGLWAVTAKAILRARTLDGAASGPRPGRAGRAPAPTGSPPRADVRFEQVPLPGAQLWTIAASAERVVIGAEDGAWACSSGSALTRICSWPSAIRSACPRPDGAVLLGTRRGEILMVEGPLTAPEVDDNGPQRV